MTVAISNLTNVCHSSLYFVDKDIILSKCHDSERLPCGNMKNVKMIFFSDHDILVSQKHNVTIIVFYELLFQLTSQQN